MSCIDTFDSIRSHEAAREQENKLVEERILRLFGVDGKDAMNDTELLRGYANRDFIRMKVSPWIEGVVRNGKGYLIPLHASPKATAQNLFTYEEQKCTLLASEEDPGSVERDLQKIADTRLAYTTSSRQDKNEFDGLLAPHIQDMQRKLSHRIVVPGLIDEDSYMFNTFRIDIPLNQTWTTKVCEPRNGRTVEVVEGCTIDGIQYNLAPLFRQTAFTHFPSLRLFPTSSMPIRGGMLLTRVGTRLHVMTGEGVDIKESALADMRFKPYVQSERWAVPFPHRSLKDRLVGRFGVTMMTLFNHADRQLLS